MFKKNITFTLLALINIVCAIFHFAFQSDLLTEQGIYREFLLIENAIITLIFVYFTTILLWGTMVQKQEITMMGFAFWAFFLLCVVIVQPTITTLTVIESLLIFPQKIYLLFVGCCALILTFLNYRHIKMSSAI